MPTVNTSTSRSFRITREYATKNGQEPLRPRELEQIAPKASKKHRAEVQQAGADASAWVPCKAVATALVTAGRSTITKPVRRVAASLATSTAGLPPTLRVIFSEDMDQSALAFAIGAAEAVEAKSRVLVVVASSQAALVEGTMDKVRALFPAAAASVVTLVDKAAAEKVALSAIKSANVVLSTVEAITALFDRKAVNGKHIFREHVSSEEGAFSVTAVLEASADVDATLRAFTVSLVPTTTRRLVIIAPSTRAAAAVPTAVAPNGGAALRNVVTINMFTVEGVQKFNLLHQLVANSGRTERVLVHFATKEIASFYCEALYALNVDATILCDVPQDEGVDEDEEGTPGTSTAITVPSVADVVAAKGLPPSHYLDGVLRRFEAAAQEGKGCVLLSGFGLQSQHATVVLEFDVPTNLQDSVDACIVAPVSRRTIAMFDPHCAPGAIAIMKHHGKARGVNVRFEQLPMPASKSVALNSMKLKSLTKKIFTLANKGFAAYRSYMHYYSLLRPTDTFNVRKLDLERCAEQYGLEEAPLLDLRTKANEFRPKEDWVKAAQRRLRLDRRETRQRMQEMFGHIGNEEEAEEEPVEAA